MRPTCRPWKRGRERVRWHHARPVRDGTAADPTAAKGVEKGRLTTSIAKHRIEAGGSRRLHQIASILSHARQRGLVPTNTGNIDNQPATSQSSQKNPLIIEMGAERGMTGRCHICLRKNIEMCTAGQSSLSARRPTVGRRHRLCVWTTGVFLAERSGMRGKAKTKVRAARGQSAADECLRLTWCTSI